jgi:sugar phosphate isomerase/epimerase
MKISVQIYSIREAGDFDAQLRLAKSAGFDWIESVGTHDLSPQAFADRVAAAGLAVSSMHVALATLETPAGLNHIREACRLTGCPLVVMPWLPMGERPATGAGWQALGRRLAALGDAFMAEGIRFAYHNHEWELLHYDGRMALDWLFSASTPQQVGWEADLGWVRRGGLAPEALAEQYADRLVSVHCKDIAAPGTAVDEDGWTTLGQGLVGWGSLFPALRRIRPALDLFVFEHDKPVHFAHTLSDSRRFMRQALAA